MSAVAVLFGESALEQARSELRRQYPTPAALTDEALDARAATQYWATRHTLLLAQLRALSAGGNRIAGALLAGDDRAAEDFADLLPHPQMLDGTRLAGLQPGHLVRVTYTDGDTLEGVVTRIGGTRPDVWLLLLDARGREYRVTADGLSSFAYL